ncbi:hypothetical protein D3C79_872100 [compost metagenome]
MLHQLRVGRRLLDDRAVRCQVALEEGDAARRVDRVGETAHHVLLVLREVFEFLAQRAATDGHGVQVQLRLELAQHRLQATGTVQVFHVVLA